MRTIDEIYQTLLESFRERAGFAPESGCDLAVRLWAAAAEIQALELQAAWVLDQCFPQTAQGVYLDRHGMTRGLSRTPAAKAAGTLRFSVDAPAALNVSIQAGTAAMTAEETRFQTTAAVTLRKGELYVDAPAEAIEPGSGGNAVPGAVRFLTACPVAVTAVTNPAAFTGGCDQEDDGAFRERILESYLRLPNGANAAWYETTAINFPGVTAAKAVGRARGTGTVDVYITGESGLPDSALLQALTAEFQEKREIAVNVQVKAPTPRTVNVHVQAAVREGSGNALENVEKAVADFFSGRLLGQPVLLAELGNRIYQAEGVENYRILSPAADLPADPTILPVLGSLQVTEMEGG